MWEPKENFIEIFKKSDGVSFISPESPETINLFKYHRIETWITDDDLLKFKKLPSEGYTGCRLLSGPSGEDRFLQNVVFLDFFHNNIKNIIFEGCYDQNSLTLEARSMMITDGRPKSSSESEFSDVFGMFEVRDMQIVPNVYYENRNYIRWHPINPIPKKYYIHLLNRLIILEQSRNPENLLDNLNRTEINESLIDDQKITKTRNRPWWRFWN